MRQSNPILFQTILLLCFSLGLSCQESTTKKTIKVITEETKSYEDWVTVDVTHNETRFHHLEFQIDLRHRGTSHLEIYDYGYKEPTGSSDWNENITAQDIQSATLVYEHDYVDLTQWKYTLSGVRARHLFKLHMDCEVELDGVVHTFSHTKWIHTPALPDYFPTLQMAESVTEPSDKLSQYIFMSLFRWKPGLDRNWGLLMAVDRQGIPVWSYLNDHGLDSYVFWPERGLFFIELNNEIVHIDKNAKEVRRWKASDFGLDSFHHELIPMQNGNLLTVATRAYDFEEGQLNAVETEPNYLISDVLVELDLETNRVVRDLELYYYWDPSVHFTDSSLNRFWETHYQRLGKSGTADWTHVNGLYLDETQDILLVSLRHLDSILALNWSTGERIWEFGRFGNVNHSGQDNVFPFHPHAPKLDQDGNLLFFDNGNGREAAEPYSQALNIKIDTNTTPVLAETLWSYQLRDNPVYAPFVGDVDDLQDRALITFGGLIEDPNLPLGSPDNSKLARIIEVSYDLAQQEQPYFDLTLSGGNRSIGYSVYRAEPLESIEF